MTEAAPLFDVVEVDIPQMDQPAYYPGRRKRRPIYLSGSAGKLSTGDYVVEQLEAAGMDIGLLLNPDFKKLHGEVGKYRVWAADNGCFAKGDSFDVMEWLFYINGLPRPEVRWGNAHEGYESRLMVPGADKVEHFGCLFVAAPDVIFDAAATWERSAPLFETVRRLGFPVALVAQDGAEDFEPMWDYCDYWDALFLGGSDEWKESEWARMCVHEAHLLGKWVHMGRVNTWRRYKIAASWHVDSVDGTYLAFGPDKNGPQLAQWLRNLSETLSLF